MIAIRMLLTASIIYILGVGNVIADDISTIEEVLNNPSTYHGRRVALTGFFEFGVERSAIFSNEKRKRGKPLSSAIWVLLKQGDIPSYIHMGYGSHCVISGTFNMYISGHLGAFNGGIEDVSFLDCDIDAFDYEDIVRSRDSTMSLNK